MWIFVSRDDDDDDNDDPVCSAFSLSALFSCCSTTDGEKAAHHSFLAAQERENFPHTFWLTGLNWEERGRRVEQEHLPTISNTSTHITVTLYLGKYYHITITFIYDAGKNKSNREMLVIQFFSLV